MRFLGLDLNLLVALDALLAEQNVSAAADRIHLSQSAMSGALNRLREYFGDELLVPMGRRMALTPRAEQLVDPVRNALMHIRANITLRPEFDPSTCDRRFLVVASDYAAVVGLSNGFSRIGALAPGMGFALLPIGGSGIERLERGEIDIFIAPEQFISADHPSHPLFSDEHVVIASADNPRLDRGLDEEAYFTLGHVVSHFPSLRPSFEDPLARPGQRARRIEIIAPSFTLVPHFVVSSHRIAMVQRRLAELYARILPLKVFDLPFPAPSMRQRIQWHRLNENDAATLWVRDRLTEAFT